MTGVSNPWESPRARLEARFKNIRILSQWSQQDNPQLSPTSANIRARLESLADQCREEDTLLVAFSGAGVQVGEPAQYCFLPADADLKDPRTLLTQTELFQTLGRCRAKLKLLEEKHAELLAEPGESIATRKLTLQSLERWMKKLKEEILRYECERLPKSQGR